MPRGNPESARAKVRAALQEHGEAAALKLGEKLGVKAGRLKRWMKLFSSTPTERRAERREGASQAPASFQTPSRFKATHYLWGDPQRLARLVKEGPEQSEVKFPNGNVRFVSNDWLTPAAKETQT